MQDKDIGFPSLGYVDKHFEHMKSITDAVLHHSDDPWLSKKR